jgi:hypothetical protein
MTNKQETAGEGILCTEKSFDDRNKINMQS